MLRDKKIFIACPITKYFDDTEKGMNTNYKEFIVNVLNICRKYSDNVFLALERERYGHARMDGDECTPLDFNEIQNSDLIIAFPEDSMGVAVELGWASALKKDMLIFIDNIYKSSPLVKSLQTITNAKYIQIQDISSNQLESILTNFLHSLNQKYINTSKEVE